MNLYEITYMVEFNRAGTAIVRAQSESDAILFLEESRPTYNFNAVVITTIPEHRCGVLFDDEGG